MAPSFLAGYSLVLSEMTLNDCSVSPQPRAALEQSGNFRLMKRTKKLLLAHVLTVLLGCADHPTLCDVLDVNTLSVNHCFSHLFSVLQY